MTFELIEPLEEELEICKQVEVSPNVLVDKFGEPMPTDLHGVSGGYYFEDANGYHYAVFDAYNTTLADAGDLLPEQFWETDNPVEFSIAWDEQAPDDALEAFISFITEE